MITTRLRHFTRTMWGLAPTESSTQRCSRRSSSSSSSSSSSTSSSSYESPGVRDEHAQRQVEQVRRPVRAEQVARHLQQQVRAQAPTLAELLFSGKWDLSWRHIWQVRAKKWEKRRKNAKKGNTTNSDFLQSLRCPRTAEHTAHCGRPEKLNRRHLETKSLDGFV